MLRSPIVRLVDFCARFPWPVILCALAVTGVCGDYAARHFAIKTDINDLFPPTLPWTQRAAGYMKAFPQRDILVVVDAPSSEFADAAAAKLASVLAADHDHFRTVEQAQGGQFFAQNGLLFMPTEELGQVAGGMQRAAPLIGRLSADPSIRGALGALGYGIIGVADGMYPRDALARPMSMAADTIEDALAGRAAHFSWRALADGKSPEPGELRRFIAIAPVLDFKALEPGRAAVDAINRAAQRLDLAGEYQARVRQTGLVPIDDDQFATLTEHAVVNLTVAIGAVVIILWLALRSWRIILPPLISVFCGLAVSPPPPLYLVGPLHLISVSFLFLFLVLRL